MGQGNSMREIVKYFKINNNESITYKNLQDVDKAVLKGKCIDADTYSKKEDTNKFTFLFLINQKKKNKLKPKQAEKQKGIINIRTEMYETEKTTEKNRPN